VQLSLFGAGAAPAALDDLEGLLVGRGRLARRGDAYRLSVVLSAPGWRVAALRAALADRGLVDAEDPEDVVAVDGLPAVRTAFSPALGPLARAWTRGAVTAPPASLRLDGPRLRLWAISAGRPDDHGYLLGLAENDPDAFGGSANDPWRRVGAALAEEGVPATPLGRRGGGPAYRVSGARRLARLRELVGDPPPDAGPDWPG
jgi:hypothetical protein